MPKNVNPEIGYEIEASRNDIVFPLQAPPCNHNKLAIWYSP